VLEENPDAGAFSRLSFELDRKHSSEGARPLHIFCVFSKIPVDDLSNTAIKAGVQATTKREGEGVYSLEIMSPKKRQLAYGYLVDYGAFWNILIKTIESPMVAEHVTRLWLRRMRPAVSRSYIKSTELLDIMDDLSNIPNSKLELRDYILRAYDSPESMKRWPRDKPYSRQELERDIKRENKLLLGLNFIFRGIDSFFNVRIQSNGQFVFYEGSRDCFSSFQRLVLSRFNEIALENYESFSNRERKTTDDAVKISKVILNPMKKLGKPDFEILSSHIGIDYSTAILHSGNPWLMLNVIDRADGSSFDIFGYSPEIQIVPSSRASAESLMRLLYTIYQIFPLMQITQETA
jgi:hypothetical protein